jgi:hypothetical protein
LRPVPGQPRQSPRRLGEDQRELAVLEAEFGRDWIIGYDRAGWCAWPRRPHSGGELRAPTPAGLRELIAMGDEAAGRTR